MWFRRRSLPRGQRCRASPIPRRSRLAPGHCAALRLPRGSAHASGGLLLTAAEQVASEQLPPDDQLDQRQQAAAALAAIAELPATLREPATLFYVHECSHQDIAIF